MLTVADRGEGGGGKICQNLADVICERSLTIFRVSSALYIVHVTHNNSYHV